MSRACPILLALALAATLPAAGAAGPVRPPRGLDAEGGARRRPDRP